MNTNKLSYGDMLNILLSNLFPNPQPTPRSANVEQIICSYNPNVVMVSKKLFKFLESLGDDKTFMESLKKELEESLRRDRLDGCVVIYRK